MTRDELVRRLKKHEWSDIEFKEARRSAPKSAYETVSAFANTAGGWLVFGVRDAGGALEVVGVTEVDKVQNEFMSTLRSGQKVSRAIDVAEDMIEMEGKTLLVFHVPESPRHEKPVYLNGDVRRSFIRRGGGDERCTQTEIERFLRDASTDRYDGQSVDFAMRTAFDTDSIRWYRATYEGRPGNRSYASLSDVDFLGEMGLLAERGGRRRPTRAAVLLFGANPAFLQLLPRPVVDCQRFSATREAADTGERWFDRLVLEENLVRTWRSLIDDWYPRIAEHPFRVDPATFQRDDTPPDYQAFRESMVNLVIHQDYAEHSRKAVIRHYTDQTAFWNPGDAFAANADLLEPGEKEVRNPRVVLAFRRIGLSENAGWGLRDVFRNWQQLGNVPPRIANDKRRKSFEIVLKKEELVSERQLALQQRLGLRLADEQARAFAFACREKDVTLSEIKAVTGLSGSGAAAVANHLATQKLLKRAGPGRYVLAEHLREQLVRTDRAGDQVHARGDLSTEHDLSTEQDGSRVKDLSTEQDGGEPAESSSGPAEPLATLSPTQRRIVELCEVPRRLAEIMGALGLTSRGYFTKRHLAPLIRAGIVAMTNLENPQAANQRYVLTEAGSAFQKLLERAGPGRYVLAEHLREQLVRGDRTGDQVHARGDLSAEQVGSAPEDLSAEQVGGRPAESPGDPVEPLTTLSATQWRIVELCEVPRRLAEIMGALGLTSRGYFTKRHLAPLIQGGIVAMTNPENPQAANQRYVLTEAGSAFRATRSGEQGEERHGQG